MKKILILSAIVCFAHHLCAQGFGYRLFAGTNFCQIDGDRMSGYHKLGFRVGANSYIKTKKDDEIGFEISFVQKGSRTAIDPDNPGQIIVRYNYNYLEVPFYFEKKIKDFGFRFGLVPGLLVSARADLGGGFTDQTNLRRYEISGSIGPNYQISDNLKFSMQYQYSIMSIINLQKPQLPGLSFRTGVYNNVISAALYYQFNQ